MSQQEFEFMLRSIKRLSLMGAILAACLAGIGAGVGGFWLLDRKRSEAHGNSHGSVRTRMDIQSIGLAVQIYVTETGQLPDALSSDAAAGVDTKRLYANLFSENAAKLKLGPPEQHWRESEDLVDRWGNALSIVVGTNGEANVGIQIWSNGPNEKNETGSGDDISGHDLRVEVRAGKN